MQRIFPASPILSIPSIPAAKKGMAHDSALTANATYQHRNPKIEFQSIEIIIKLNLLLSTSPIDMYNNPS
jgi:hypothetical protein